MTPTAFYQSELDQPHPARARAMIRAHPEIRQLIGRNPSTAFIAVAVVILQSSIAYGMGKLGLAYWWFALAIAYGVGAFANHAMYVVIHEATHNLVYRTTGWNRLLALIADLPNLLPVAMGFRIYHLKHHAHQGEYALDVDIPSRWEARLAGNRWYAKAIWMLFQPLFQLTRPPRLRAIAMWNRWLFVNLFISTIYTAGILYFCGWTGLIYLLASLFFSLGLHPLGGRWIQEHVTHDPAQETASYYGPLNRLCLNVGYHNEHHDFPSVPWNNLPKVRALAPEFYDTLRCHSSWWRLLFEFVFDHRYNLFLRVERTQQSKAESRLANSAIDPGRRSVIGAEPGHPGSIR